MGRARYALVAARQTRQVSGMASSSHHDNADFRLESPPLSIRQGVVRADDFDDVYFSADDGLGETQHVFIDGNDLPARLAAQHRFTIAETGFGTGLNFLAVLALYEDLQRASPDSGREIDFISFESRPLDAVVMAMAHRAFPAVATHSAALIDALPPRWPGLHRRNFADGRVRLHLIYGAADSALQQADFRADAWFLDGFTPAKNPSMWSADLLGEVGRLTRAGGSVASFTAARLVRQHLAAAGFDVEKRPGFGRKRDMIIGRKRGAIQSAVGSALGVVGVIGGGIAGAAVAAGLQARGVDAQIIDKDTHLAAGASGNRLGVQSPRLAVDHNPLSRLSADCLSYAAWCSDRSGAAQASQVVALDWPDREAVRHAKFRRQYWPDELMRPIDQDTAASVTGIALPSGGMQYDQGRVIDPPALVRYLAQKSGCHLGCDVAAIARADGGFQVITADQRTFYFDRIVLAAGADLDRFHQMLAVSGIPVDITTGQVSQVPAVAALAGLRAGISFGGYLTPAVAGWHELGASFDRNGFCQLSAAADIANRDRLPAALASLMPDPASYRARVSRRASTPDRGPVSGRLAAGLYVLGALGARGLTMAPLLGDMLAAEIVGTPVTINRAILQLIDPFRFRMRASRL